MDPTVQDHISLYVSNLQQMFANIQAPNENK